MGNPTETRTIHHPSHQRARKGTLVVLTPPSAPPAKLAFCRLHPHVACLLVDGC